MKTLVLYDGTIHARKAVAYALEKSRGSSGETVVLHVFNATVFLDYDGGPRALELGRRESLRHLDELKKFIAEQEASPRVRILSEEGEPGDLASRIAREEMPDLILVPERLRSLARVLPAPVSTVPGTILFPLDSGIELPAALGEVIREAKALAAKVVVLGVLPVHLYSRSEKKELEELRRATFMRLKNVRKTLQAEGIESSDVLREGYPDEEILKAAEEFTASLVMVPSGGAAPSELAKAAIILRDEPERVRMPVLFLPETGAA
jgi:nucleotide-binding universal stress UspA family protein